MAQFTLEQLYFALACIGVIGFLVIFYMLVKSVSATMRRLNRTMNRVDGALREVEETLKGLDPVVKGLADLERSAVRGLDEIADLAGRMGQKIEPVIDELAATARAFQELERSIQARMDQDVPPVLHETRDTVANVKDITSDIKMKIEATDELFEAVRETSHTVRTVSGILRSGLTGLAVQVASMAVGARKSLEYVSENLYTKGGES